MSDLSMNDLEMRIGHICIGPIIARVDEAREKGLQRGIAYGVLLPPMMASAISEMSGYSVPSGLIAAGIAVCATAFGVALDYSAGRTELRKSVDAISANCSGLSSDLADWARMYGQDRLMGLR